jgi:hypothetical protein
LECGGKAERDIALERVAYRNGWAIRKRRRRYALPAQSKEDWMAVSSKLVLDDVLGTCGHGNLLASMGKHRLFWSAVAKRSATPLWGTVSHLFFTILHKGPIARRQSSIA